MGLDIILAHAYYDAQHLSDVTAEMRTLGAPTIRAVHLDGDLWLALEGCHRIRAALTLGLTPDLIEMEYSNTTTTVDLGLDYQDIYTVADLVDRIGVRPCIIRF